MLSCQCNFSKIVTFANRKVEHKTKEVRWNFEKIYGSPSLDLCLKFYLLELMLKLLSSLARVEFLIAFGLRCLFRPRFVAKPVHLKNPSNYNLPKSSSLEIGCWKFRNCAGAVVSIYTVGDGLVTDELAETAIGVSGLTSSV